MDSRTPEKALKDDYGKLLVRRVAAQPEHPAHDTLLDLAAGSRLDWTMDAWDRILAQLDRCNQRIRDWEPPEPDPEFLD